MTIILFSGTRNTAPAIAEGSSVFASGEISLAATIGDIVNVGTTYTTGIYEAIATEIELTDTELFVDNKPPSKAYAQATFSVTDKNANEERSPRVYTVDIITASATFEFMRGTLGVLQIANKIPVARNLHYTIWKKQ